MRNIGKLFVQLACLNDDGYERQPERTAERVHLCTKGNSCVSVATFGLGSWSLAFTHRFAGPGL